LHREPASGLMHKTHLEVVGYPGVALLPPAFCSAPTDLSSIRQRRSTGHTHKRCAVNTELQGPHRACPSSGLLYSTASKAGASRLTERGETQGVILGLAQDRGPVLRMQRGEPHLLRCSTCSGRPGNASAFLPEVPCQNRCNHVTSASTCCNASQEKWRVAWHAGRVHVVTCCRRIVLVCRGLGGTGVGRYREAPAVVGGIEWLWCRRTGSGWP
jgi:hypothetical protein